MDVFISRVALAITLFSSSALAGSIPSNLDGVAAKRANGGSSLRAKRSLSPVRGIRKLHDGFVNLAINLSSIGIDQPAARLDHTPAPSTK